MLENVIGDLASAFACVLIWGTFGASTGAALYAELFACMECLWQSRFGCASSWMESKVPSHQVGRILLYPHVPMYEYAYYIIVGLHTPAMPQGLCIVVWAEVLFTRSSGARRCRAQYDVLSILQLVTISLHVVLFLLFLLFLLCLLFLLFLNMYL